MIDAGRTHRFTLFSILLMFIVLSAAFHGHAAAAPAGPPPQKDGAANPASHPKGPRGHRNTASFRLNRAAATASTRIAQSGVLCEPAEPPPAVQACVGKAAGDACTVDHEEHTFTGVCATTPRGLLACQPPIPPPPPQSAVAACADKVAGDSCQLVRDDDEDGDDNGDEQDGDHEGEAVDGICRSFASGVVACVPIAQPLERLIDACAGIEAGAACSITHDDTTVNGTCTAIALLGGLVVCVPQMRVPPPVTACDGKAAGDPCSFSHDGRTIEGNCATPPGGDGLVCLPPPRQALIDACMGKAVNDACSVTLFEHTFTGVCGTAPDGTTVACMPQRESEPSPRVTACVGLTAGTLCTVPDRDHDEEGDDDDDAQRGLCRPNDEGVLACLPPAPPQEAIDACTGLAVGDTCSFPWRDQTLTGACRALLGGATLVCAPLCPDMQSLHR